MTVEEGLVAELLADAGVSALVGTRVYRLLPQNVTYPAIQYQRISAERFNTLDGPNDLTQIRMQVDSWSDSYEQVKALATAVRQALNGVRNTLGSQAVQHVYLVAGDTDDVTIDGDRIDHRVTQDYMVLMQEI